MLLCCIMMCHLSYYCSILVYGILYSLLYLANVEISEMDLYEVFRFWYGTALDNFSMCGIVLVLKANIYVYVI